MNHKALITGLSIVSVVSITGVIWLLASPHSFVDPGPASSQYNKVTYPMNNSTQLKEAKVFYALLFDQDKTIRNNEIEYDIKGLKVVVKAYDSDASIGRLQLAESQFSWIVDSVKHVNEKREKLIRYNPSDIQVIRDSPKEEYRVVKFTVIDPAGNRISVSNNPIYP